MQIPHWNSRFTLLASAAAVAVLVSACGGGSGGGSDSSPAGSSITLSGYAATGLAMAGATVNIKCATGNATASTIASGFYTTTLNNAALPCVLQVRSADGLTTLHSVAAGSGGGTVVANVTPLTELVLAQAAGQAPATFFNAFSSTQTATVSAESLAAAVTKVATALFSSVSITTTNPFTDALVPATLESPTTGNAYDRLLDQLATSVANARTTLTAIVSQVAAGSTTVGSSLQSTLATDFAAGIFGVHYDDYRSQWNAEVHRSTSGPVNGVYSFTGGSYVFASGVWGAADNSDNNRVLTAGGWVLDGADLAATVKQTGLTSFLYTSATQSTQMTMVSSSPATYRYGALTNVTLPTGSKVFEFTQTYVSEKYQLNGGSGFSHVTSLADFRSQHSSSSEPVQWNGGSLAQGALLQWRFGPGTTSGTLLLSLNYPDQNPPVLENGTWEVKTVMGKEVMVLDIPASVDASASTHSGLAAGQKFIYALTPEGNVQEGRYFSAGASGSPFTNFNRIAANAIIAAIGGLASLPN
ncbi:hypothetical protein os1_39730 [Comamonadaceae bacterium OS-1]|nr:hypothetical protein os1_39730 [Comamonadaceae bacterium OS-1]